MNPIKKTAEEAESIFDAFDAVLRSSVHNDYVGVTLRRDIFTDIFGDYPHMDKWSFAESSDESKKRLAEKIARLIHDSGITIERVVVEVGNIMFNERGE